jgi:hypothetical protein
MSLMGLIIDVHGRLPVSSGSAFASGPGAFQPGVKPGRALPQRPIRAARAGSLAALRGSSPGNAMSRVEYSVVAQKK